MSSSPHHWLFEAGSDGHPTPLLLLHGSSGTEADLLPLAGRLVPGAPRLAVRGSVALNDGYAFFRRHPDRRVDEADLRFRVPALAGLIESFGTRFARPPVVVGYSNGAVMGAALVATHPGLLAGAVLLRPLSPFTAAASYRRGRIPVLIIDGAQDDRRSTGDGARLATRLSRAGALVSHRVLAEGHRISVEDERIARQWLEMLPRG